ncbi:hypothetical protein [Senegalia massiliensis]|uniref:hypothetical protein n=1 Tax=Senegalia massiliensis TaxID=1720316 RepID=UPI0010308D2F|nr:hypothetical protein [Senegalia massiliensis]
MGSKIKIHNFSKRDAYSLGLEIESHTKMTNDIEHNIEGYGNLKWSNYNLTKSDFRNMKVK